MAEPTKKDQGKGQATTSQAPAKQESPLALMKRTVIDVVAEKARKFVENGELNLPANYSINNAIKAAWIIMQTVEDKNHNKALSVCTQNSIANSLLDMIVQGLNPMKKQCYFIVYGTTLACQRSYFGSMAIAKMVEPRIDDFAFAVVYEKDIFKYGIQNGKKTIVEHSQDIKNVDKDNIIAAYCIALNKEGGSYKTEIMTIDEIHQAWKHSKMNPFDDKTGKIKDGSTHEKFTGEMALKTVINRCCKAIINASSDNALLLERIRKNDELIDRSEVDEEIDEQENLGDVIDVTEKKAELPPEVSAVEAKAEEKKTPF